jgi:hypothetical protein
MSDDITRQFRARCWRAIFVFCAIWAAGLVAFVTYWVKA